MDAKTWERIERIFFEALEKPPEERSAYVESACSGAPDLLEEIEAMLSSHESDSLQVERRLLADGRPEDESMRGIRVGPWTLERLLGRGGMGEVWLGERDDDFRQTAAVKLVRPGWRAAELVTRFRRERQILAQLVHPHIAKLLDGGVADDGRPWLAMEYVDGVPVTKWCLANGVPVRDRVKLFRVICDTVRFAHANLVVHRDLKPANILVTPEGRPVLLDFGIAKLLDPDADETDDAPTRPEERVLTPEYAAPEQVRGEPVTTAADVWALGVLLYELLADERPFDVAGRPSSEAGQVVLETDPEPPSTKAPKERASALRGDLDAIALNAMRRDPERRYASVEALSADVDRWLAGLPVQARPDSLAYRTRKFVRRNRLGVAIAAGFAALVLGFAVVTSRQSARIAAERDRAMAEQEKSERVLQVLVDLFEQSNPQIVPGGDALPVSEFLELGERELEELEDQPEVRARLWETMSAIHGARSQFDRQRAALGRALEAAREAGLEDEELRLLHYRARLLSRIEGGDEARSLLRESLEAHERARGPDHPDVAVALQDLAQITVDPDERRALLERALEIVEKHFEPNAREVASVQNALGQLYWGTDDFLEAARWFSRSLAILEQIFPPEHPAVLAVRANVAAADHRIGHFDVALENQKELLEVRRRILGDETMEVASSLNSIGISLANLGRHEEAIEALQHSVDVYASLLGPDHALVGSGERNLGLVEVAAGRGQEGLAGLQEAIRITELSPAMDAHSLPYLRVQEAGARLALGEAVNPDPVLAHVEEMRSAPNVPHRRLADVEILAGLCLLELGRVPEAEAAFRRAYDLRHRFTPEGHPERAEAICALAAVGALSAGETPPDLAATHRIYAAWGLAHPVLLRRVQNLDPSSP